MATLLWACSLLAAPSAPPPAGGVRYVFAERHMGVEVRLAFYGDAGAADAAAGAARAAFARVARLDAILSDWEPESELSRFGAEAFREDGVAPSPELWTVLERGQEMARRSDGAFDLTVGPFVRLWRVARRTRELPSPDALESARAAVGWPKLRLDPVSRRAAAIVAGMRLDAGGIAKGYAADEARRVLEARGFPRALVAIAGDIVAGAPPPGEAGWRIGVAPASDPEAAPVLHLRIAHGAVSTSGDAYQHVEIGGRRFSHIVDPRTGLGLETRCSVTVVAPEGIDADALATAACVLGPERGLALIESTPGAAALFTSLDDGLERVQRSSRFAAFVED